MTDLVETKKIAMKCDKPISMDAIAELRHEFCDYIMKEPQFIEVSPNDQYDLKALMPPNSVSSTSVLSVMGMNVRVNPLLKKDEWSIATEKIITYAV